MRMNQSDLAAVVGVTRQAISAFEQGEKFPDPDTMASISRALAQPIGFFTMTEPDSFGEFSTRFFRAFGPDTKRRNLACDVLARWFAQTAFYIDRSVNYPPLDLPSVSPSSADGSYGDDEIEDIADGCRRHWGLGSGPISNVVSLMENRGVILTRIHMIGERIDAFSFWNGQRAFVFLASDDVSPVRARFDAAHELGHLLMHRWVDQNDLEDGKLLNRIEREANKFAGALLLPRASFSSEVYTTRLSAFIDLKLRWKVAIQAMVYRCKNLELFDDDQVTNLYKQISARKWKSKEPLDDSPGIPLEEPRLLARALKMMLDGGVKQPDQVPIELGLSNLIVEQLCGVSAGRLAPNFLGGAVVTLK